MSKPERLGDTWREFERLLLAWRPAVAVPYAQWHSTNTSSKSVAETIALYDHMVLALSSSAVDCMMPYEVRWDEDSLDYSVIPSYIIGHLLFPDQVLQFKSLSAINKVPLCRRYFVTTIPFRLFKLSLPSLTSCRIPATGRVTYCPSCALSCGLSAPCDQTLASLICSPHGFIVIQACPITARR